MENSNKLSQKGKTASGREKKELKCVTWSCIRLIIVFVTVAFVFCCCLAYMIAQELSKDKGTTEKETTLVGEDVTRCGLDSFMIGDGICDELTNTENCQYDGGDCCLDSTKKDTSLCETCTCKMPVNTTELKAKLESTDVRMFQNLSDYESLIWKTSKVFNNIISEEACFAFCLDSEVQELVNGWRLNRETNTCTCSWLNSTKCLTTMDLATVTFQNYSELSLASTKAFVQIAKTVDCDCLKLNQVFKINMHGESRLEVIDKFSDVFSEWHCQNLCQKDQNCSIFSWSFLGPSSNECYLMSSLSQELELSVYEGWISGVANCNQSTISFKDNTTEIIGPIVENISKCQASASSIFDNAENFYGPDNAVDGILMATDGATGSVLTVTHYMSDPNDPSPWVQLDCGSPVSIAIVMITAMYDIEVRNVSIHVGNKMAMFGQQSQNQLCAPTVNEIAPRSYKVIECVKVVHGQFVQFQMQSPMSLQEVIVFFPTQWPPDLKEKMVPRTQISSSASSIHENNPNYRSPDFLTDGVLAAQNRFFFHSDDSDPDPWIQMELTQSWIIARIVVIQRLDCCGQRFVNIQVHIGFFSAQKREENSLCTTFEGPSKTGAQDVMTCEETLEGTNVFFSKYEFVQSPPHPLNMEEIILIGSAA